SKGFEFANPEWGDDDPYMDDWYELDDEAPVDTEEKSQDNEPYANLVAAILAKRDEPAVRDAIDYCISLRDSLDDGQEDRDQDQEPDTSTPADEDDDLALRMQMRSREIELDTI